MQNLLRLEYEKILLLAAVIFRGDYPTTFIFSYNAASEIDKFEVIFKFKKQAFGLVCSWIANK